MRKSLFWRQAIDILSHFNCKCCYIFVANRDRNFVRQIFFAIDKLKTSFVQVYVSIVTPARNVVMRV